MILRNFLKQPAELVENCHDGEGVIRNTTLFAAEDFETPLHFVNYTELDPGTSVGHHRHGDNEEMYIILEGTGEMTVNNETVAVVPGDALLNKPGWAHGLKNTGSEMLKILVFEVGKI